jgi:hypothetical protein
VTDRREMRRNSWNKAISRDKTGTAPPLTYVDWDTTGRDLSGCPQPATISGKLIEPYVVEAALALLPTLAHKVESGESGGVVCAKLDRFARSAADGLAAVRRIERAGGTFVLANTNSAIVNQGIARTIPSSDNAWVVSTARKTPTAIPSAPPMRAVMMLSWRIIRLTCRRVIPTALSIPSSRVRSNTASGAAHSLQNFAPSGFSLPQLEQTTTRRV